MTKGTDIGTEYFVADYVRQQLSDHGFSDDEIFGGGLRIYTTLDLNAQQAAWDAVTSTLAEPDDPSSGRRVARSDNHVRR